MKQRVTVSAADSLARAQVNSIVAPHDSRVYKETTAYYAASSKMKRAEERSNRIDKALALADLRIRELAAIASTYPAVVPLLSEAKRIMRRMLTLQRVSAIEQYAAGIRDLFTQGYALSAGSVPTMPIEPAMPAEAERVVSVPDATVDTILELASRLETVNQTAAVHLLEAAIAIETATIDSSEKEQVKTSKSHSSRINNDAVQCKRAEKVSAAKLKPKPAESVSMNSSQSIRDVLIAQFAANKREAQAAGRTRAISGMDGVRVFN